MTIMTWVLGWPTIALEECKPGVRMLMCAHGLWTGSLAVRIRSNFILQKGPAQPLRKEGRRMHCQEEPVMGVYMLSWVNKRRISGCEVWAQRDLQSQAWTSRVGPRLSLRTDLSVIIIETSELFDIYTSLFHFSLSLLTPGSSSQ